METNIYITCLLCTLLLSAVLTDAAASFQTNSDHSIDSFQSIVNGNTSKSRSRGTVLFDTKLNEFLTADNGAQTHASNGIVEGLNPTAVSSTTVVDSTPMNEEDLPTLDISQCIFANSSLNLTIGDEITIFYVSHEYSNIDGSDKTTVNPTFSAEISPNPVRKSGEYEHARNHSSTFSNGICSLFIEAPPRKVLSILFLNQTCSRDNVVRVHDVQDGFSATLNGCYPWKSPGYDVTTANSSAELAFHLRNVTDAYTLKIHVVAAALQTTDGFLTRYVSPGLGYIQTLGWHPFTRSFPAKVNSTAAVKIPSGHVTLVSVVYVYLISEHNDIHPVELMKVDKDSKRPKLVWRTTTIVDSRPDVVQLHDAVEFRLNLVSVYTGFFAGIRVLFSFHQAQSLTKRHYSWWACSRWPHVLHFVCKEYNRYCSEAEDEGWCPRTACQLDGMQFDDICYFFLYLSRRSSWQHARAACKREGGSSLASFSTIKSWFHLNLLTQTQYLPDYIFLGLQSADESLPHMYRYLLQWIDGPVAHYHYVYSAATPPICSYIKADMVTPRICNLPISVSALALCKATPTALTEAKKKPSQKSSGAALAHQHHHTSKATAELRNCLWGRLSLPSVSCPQLHRTHEFLARDAFSACRADDDSAAASEARSGWTTNDNSSTGKGSAGGSGGPSFTALFACRAGAALVPYSLVCDHLRDCVDNSDEDFCVFPLCAASWQYECANGQCVEFGRLCDQLVHCVDESDEADCTTKGATGTLYYQYQPRPPLLGDFDGRGFLVYTPLTEGERGGDTAALCPDTHVFCPGDGYCLPVYVRCNSVHDCPGQEDEAGCEDFTCPGFYRCRGLLTTCLHPAHLCDGWPQCPQNDDELFCNLTCPGNCTCLGHAFTCIADFPVEKFSRLRYLDAGGTGLKPERFANNSMLTYLSLSGCHLTHLGDLRLPNLLRFDLSDNKIEAVSLSELNGLVNLQKLSLARNPVTKLFSRTVSANVSANEILHIDLTSVQLTELDVGRSLPFPKLRSLNLSKSGVTRVVGDGFRSLTALSALDLRGCPMREFRRDVFQGLEDLRLVFADNYKLCCPANLPDGFSASGCQAPFSEVSSCDALLRSDAYRVCLVVLAVLALSGNLGCFCLRVLSLTGGGKTGFTVFVTHLCVSDFVMGVYLVMIGAADRAYLGRYLWEDSSWRRGAACQVAGALALLSSEVSALIICLITLDRFLVIRFPFSGLRFSSFSAQIASLMTWTAGVALVVVPLLPMTLSWRFYGQTGICVPLPVSRNDAPRDRYAFGVMILFNMVIFLLIAVGQISVYLSMTRNAMSSVDTTRKSRDLTVARRLITVVVSDFLCWFPIGLLGVLAAQGVPIPGEVNVGMAIFVLPLNSALNPFLYTLNLIQERRRRSKEQRLLRVIMDGGIDADEGVKNKE